MSTRNLADQQVVELNELDLDGRGGFLRTGTVGGVRIVFRRHRCVKAQPYRAVLTKGDRP